MYRRRNAAVFGRSVYVSLLSASWHEPALARQAVVGQAILHYHGFAKRVRLFAVGASLVSHPRSLFYPNRTGRPTL